MRLVRSRPALRALAALATVVLLGPGALAEPPRGPPAPAAGAPRALDPRRLLPLVELDAAGAPGLREPLAGPLVVRYVELREGGVEDVTPAALAAAGVERAGLRALAVRNLKGLLAAVDLSGRDGLLLVTAGGEYEASLLLVEELWAGGDLPRKVKGELVVAVPARDLLLVTGTGEPEGLRKLRELAAKVMKEGTATLTDRPLVWRGGRFVAYEGP